MASLERTPRAARAAVHPGRGGPAARVAGRAVRREGGAGQGAPGARRTRLARRRGALGGLRPAGVRRCARPSSTRANDMGVASIHLSLSHDAGIASAVVVLEY